MNTLPLAINRERLMGEIERLSQFSDAPAPAVTPILYPPTDLAARAYLRELSAAAGLAWRVDAIGNPFLHWEGRDRALPAVATGSHIDAGPFSGKYEGVVGGLGALEAVRALQASGFQPQRSLEIILFTAEEPTRFGLGYIGSRARASVIDPASLLALSDGEGLAFDPVRQAAGFDGPRAEVRLAPGPMPPLWNCTSNRGQNWRRQACPSAW